MRFFEPAGDFAEKLPPSPGGLLLNLRYTDQFVKQRSVTLFRAVDWKHHRAIAAVNWASRRVLFSQSQPGIARKHAARVPTPRAHPTRSDDIRQGMTFVFMSLQNDRQRCEKRFLVSTLSIARSGMPRFCPVAQSIYGPLKPGSISDRIEMSTAQGPMFATPGQAIYGEVLVKVPGGFLGRASNAFRAV